MKAVPSISVQILLAVLFTVVSILGVYSIIELNVLKQRETRTLQRRGTLTTDRIANSLAYPLWNLNREETEHVVLDEMGSVDVFMIQVFDENSDLYVGKVKGADGAIKNLAAGNATTVTPPQGTLYSYSKSINFRDNSIGRVKVDLTDANLLAQRRDLRWGFAIKLFLLATALSLVLFLTLRGLVIRPLSSLRSWVENVPLGNEVRPPRFKRSAEINALGEAFGSMSVSLQKKNEELEIEQANLQELNRQMEAEIEERKRTEEALRALEKRFSIAFNASPIPLSITSLDDGGRFLVVNERFLTTTGFTRDEVIGRTALELGIWRRPDDRHKLVQRLFAEGNLRDVEARMWTKNGEELVFLVSVEMIELEGQLRMLFAIVDITERKEAERRASELAYFLSKMREAVIVTDLHNRFIYWNDGAEQTFGWSAADVMGKTAEDLFPDGPMAELETPRKSIAETGEWQGELPNIDKDGRQFFTDSSWTLVRNADGQPEAVVSVSADITERKQAENALRASEQRFVDLFNLSPYRMGIVRRRDGIILAVNDCWVRENGVPREEAVNHPIFEWEAKVGPEAIQRVRRILEEGKPFHGLELRFKTTAGNDVVTLASGELVEIDGETCFLWAANDITERERAEQALRESEEIFRTLAETVSAGIYIYRDANFVYANPAAERLTGYTHDEFLGMTLMDLIHPDFHKVVEERTETRQRGESLPPHFEDKILTKSGEERWMDVTAAKTSFLGQPAVIVTTFDITERKRAEELLQASEKRFSIAFNANPVLATISRLEGGRFLAVNDRFIDLSGYSREEAVGHTAPELGLWPNSEERADVLRMLKEEGRVRNYEARFRTKSGEERVMLLSVETIELEGQTCFLNSAIDITHRQQAELALRTSQNQLRALSAKVQSAREEEGTRIAREIHDELGSALTGLKWDLEKMNKTLAPSEDDAAVAAARDRIGVMTGLIEETINTVRRISSELRPSILDDLGLVAAIEWQAQQFRARTGIEFDFDTQLETAELNRESATAVFRIFQEILTNVLRHSGASRITVELQKCNGHFDLKVKDNGRGISETEKGNTRSLGLLGMKERALLVGGEVTIAGAPGTGTTVIVRVPAAT